MTPEDRQALSELGSRIAAMERRLRNAKAARDSYVNFLREKYPEWRPSKSFAAAKGVHASKDSMVNRLLTSDYNWDEERDRRQKFLPTFKPRPLYEDIPTRGPLLTSDMERIRRRLTEISGQLRTIRENRLNLTTEDYLRRKVEIADSGVDTASIMAIRSRLSDIALTTFAEPVATPTSDQIAFMKFDEERDNYMADIRAGRIGPSSIEQTKPLHSTTSTTVPAATVELPQTVDEVHKVEPTKDQPEMVLSSNKSSAAEAHIPERRIIKFQDEQPRQSQVETSTKGTSEPAPPPQQSSVYQKMMGLFGNTSTSDTEDDISVHIESSTNVLKPQVSQPLQPVAQPSSASMLSQYLAAASSTTKDATPSSDSDDDFFK